MGSVDVTRDGKVWIAQFRSRNAKCPLATETATAYTGSANAFPVTGASFVMKVSKELRGDQYAFFCLITSCMFIRWFYDYLLVCSSFDFAGHINLSSRVCCPLALLVCVFVRTWVSVHACVSFLAHARIL